MDQIELLPKHQTQIAKRLGIISKASPIIDELERMTRLPLGNYYLTKGQVDAITGCRFDLPAAR